MNLEDLDRGDKQEIHISLYARELEIIDDLRRRHNCSRAAVIGAWVKMFRDTDLTGKVSSGYRPGSGGHNAKRSR